MENASTTLITIEELCEELMIGKNTAYKLLTSGEIKNLCSHQKSDIVGTL